MDNDPAMADRSRADLHHRVSRRALCGLAGEKQDGRDDPSGAVRHPVLDLVPDPGAGLAPHAGQGRGDQHHPAENRAYRHADRGAAVFRAVGHHRHDADLCRLHGGAHRLYAGSDRPQHHRGGPRPWRRVWAHLLEDHLSAQPARRRGRGHLRQRDGAWGIRDIGCAVRKKGEPSGQYHRDPGRIAEMGHGLGRGGDPHHPAGHRGGGLSAHRRSEAGDLSDGIQDPQTDPRRLCRSVRPVSLRSLHRAEHPVVSAGARRRTAVSDHRMVHLLVPASFRADPAITHRAAAGR
mmetsp:Transcript_4037/g.6586  ORF Transcript_4037/g.6586 Transcript_4037/m.6586 type:complete len:292 (-) Transcript_4037:342-1217(-)